MNSHDMSQIVITESAFSCMLNQIARSNIGKLSFNEKKFNQFFMVDGYKLDSSSLSQHIRIFKEKLGDNVPLKMNFEFRDIVVKFGQNDLDMSIDYSFHFKVYRDALGSPELIGEDI